MINKTEGVINAPIVIISFLIFLYNVFKNYQIYQEGRTIFTVTQETQTYTPPVVICPSIPLNPIRLLDFGLELNTTSYKAADKDFRILKGVPENTSLLQIMEQAVWPLGSLIKELHFGRVNEYYNISTRISPFWKHSGKNALCYELMSLPVWDSDTLILGKRENVEITHHYQSSISDNDRKVTGGSSALKIIQKLNTDTQISYFAKGCTINSWISPLHKVKKSHHIASYYSVNIINYQRQANAKSCQDKCYHYHGNRSRYCFLGFPKPQETLRKPCRLSSIVTAKDECLKNCGNLKSVHRWRILEQKQIQDRNILKISVKGNKKRISENYVYTTYKFYSDVGGCLNLFLGLSFFAVYACAKDSVTKYHLCEPVRLNLISFSLKVLFSILTSVHILLALQEVVQQPLQFSVTLESNTINQNVASLEPSSENISFFENNNKSCLIYQYPTPHSSQKENQEEKVVQNALAERLAMRAFGCRIPSVTDNLVECIFGKQTSAIFGTNPFRNISDLPMCSDIVLSFPVMKYFVPTDMTEIAHERAVIRQCLNYQTNNDVRITNDSVKFRFNIDEGNRYTYSDIFVEICGIIGLYLGISIFSILCQILNGDMATEKAKKFGLKSMYIFAMLILIIITLIIYWIQLYTFLFSHPFSITTHVRELGDISPVSATVCPWPPINTLRLLDSATHHMSQSDIDKPNLEDRLKQIAAEFSLNGTRFREVWQSSQWDLALLNGQQSQKPSYQVGYKCYQLNQRGFSKNFYHLHDMYNESIQLFVSFHASDDTSLLDFHYKSKTVHVFVTKISDYIPLGEKSNEKCGTCINTCVKQQLLNKFQCDILFFGEAFQGINCNYSVLLDLLKWAFQKELNIGSVYPFMSDIRNFEKDCKIICHKCSKTFLHFHDNKEKKEVIAPGFTAFSRIFVNVEEELTTREVTEEYDGFSCSQLISKLGGATGVLLGISVLSSLKIVLAFLRRGRDPLQLFHFH